MAMSPRLSKDNIYEALRTIDITNIQQDLSQSTVWSTPVKGQSSSIISLASPSIPYASPTRNRSSQSSTCNPATPGTV
jgi:hypothetical protein